MTILTHQSEKHQTQKKTNKLEKLSRLMRTTMLGIFLSEMKYLNDVLFSEKKANILKEWKIKLESPLAYACNNLKIQWTNELHLNYLLSTFDKSFILTLKTLETPLKAPL